MLTHTYTHNVQTFRAIHLYIFSSFSQAIRVPVSRDKPPSSPLPLVACYWIGNKNLYI